MLIVYGSCSFRAAMHPFRYEVPGRYYYENTVVRIRAPGRLYYYINSIHVLYMNTLLPVPGISTMISTKFTLRHTLIDVLLNGPRDWIFRGRIMKTAPVFSPVHACYPVAWLGLFCPDCNSSEY